LLQLVKALARYACQGFFVGYAEQDERFHLGG
jgi:hypothetical protein